MPEFMEFEWDHLPRRPIEPAPQHPKTHPRWGLPRADGREVFLEALHQYYIYRGHLMGFVHPPAQAINEAIANAKKQYSWVGSEPVLVEPVLLEYSILHTPWRKDPNAQNFRPVTLPRVASIGLFFSGQFARDDQESFSSLVVIWFQEGFGNPDEETLRQIAALDWNALAYDWMP